MASMTVSLTLSLAAVSKYNVMMFAFRGDCALFSGQRTARGRLGETGGGVVIGVSKVVADRAAPLVPIEAEVDCLDGMCECAYGNDVNAGACHIGDAFQRHVSGSFHSRASSDELYSSLSVFQ